MHQGVVAAGHDLTARAAAAVLRDGGNAVDAAIASISMACLCEPVLCSPGSGAFAMVRDGSDRSVHLLDAFVQTPRRHAEPLDDGEHVVHADFGTARQAFRIGPATTATPGLFDGLAALRRRFGSVPMDALVSDAVRAARTGITVTAFQHHLFTVVEPILTATPGARELFAPDGALLGRGATFRNPGLADALELIARDGFRTSRVGEAVIDQQLGRGHLTVDDLDRYEVAWRPPLTVENNGDRVHLNPLPAAGGALVGHSLRQLATGSAVELAAALAATTHARRDAGGELAALLDRPIRRRGTTHVSVVDAAGTACSITASNGEGNGELVDGFGFMLNNILGEDDVNPHHSAWPTDTRLSSMMCPTIVEHADGAVTALGSGGSNRIRSAISRVVAALWFDRSDLSNAVQAPRLHAELTEIGDVRLDIEPGLDDTTVAQLLSLFPHHRLWPAVDLYFGGVHAAQRAADGSMSGAGDPRRSGASVVTDA
jgi:gamma-glutamyltranspeptidase/glutathione hydrolase